MADFTTPRGPFPPFTLETAQKKVKAAQDAWNTKNPHIIKFAYTPDTIWRNRDTFAKGTEEIVEFLTKKWEVENGYRLRKELFAFTDNKVTTFKFSDGIIADGNRLLCNFGMNGMMPLNSGGERMGSKIGPLLMMGG
jgi:nuclear transport factor 2 (NTF2) superfamily protein